MNNDLVSVIVPIYNNAQFIVAFINNLFNQSHSNIEVILINDGSTDGTEAICRKLEEEYSQITYAYQDNAGPGIARNNGIARAHGKYIMFFDIDDEFDNDYIEFMVRKIKKYNCDFVRTNYYLSTKSDKYYKKGIEITKADAYINTNPKQFVDEILLGNVPTFLWLLIVRTDFIKKIDLFPRDIYYMEDKLFYLEIFMKAESMYLTNSIFYYYYYKNFKRSRDFWERYAKNTSLVYSVIRERLLHHKIFTEERERLVNSMAFTTINHSLQSIFKNTSPLKYQELGRYLKSMPRTFMESNLNLNVNFYHSWCYYLITHRRYALLLILYKLRGLMKNEL